jgi:hypothetical protein
LYRVPLEEDRRSPSAADRAQRLRALTVEERLEAQRRDVARRNRQANADLARSVRELLREQGPGR